jgi:hypothetical protein
MGAGDDLRTLHGGHVLALFAIDEVRRHRQQLSEHFDNRRGTVYVHDSAMHPDELATFRQTYGGGMLGQRAWQPR